MNGVEDYLSLQEKLMQASFKHIRSSYRDSDVKGAANEVVVSEFIKQYFSVHFVATNSEIVDSFGNRSDEIDVCVCNKDQPANKSQGGILIAEGIDFVVQVKATLTKAEIRRAIKNCRSIKSLKRRIYKNDIFAALEADIPYYVHRIPYFIFAFSAGAKFETLCRNIYDLTEHLEYTYQPDAIFVLGEGFIVNCRDGKGTGPEVNGNVPEGMFAFQTKQNLSDFIKYIHLLVPRFYRVVDPLSYYIRNKIELSQVQQL